jgi:hypothetical protein
MSKLKRNRPVTSKSISFRVTRSDSVENKILSSRSSTNTDTIGSGELSVDIETIIEIITEATKRIKDYTSELQEFEFLSPTNISPTKSEMIAKEIESIIAIKAKRNSILSWGAVIADCVDKVVIRCDVLTPEELLDLMTLNLENLTEMFDKAINSSPSNISVMGLTLAPDQRQISEARSLISFTHSKIDKIRQEIAEGYIDWGKAEQSALERLMDDNTDFVSGEEMFDWIERLEAGEDV